MKTSTSPAPANPLQSPQNPIVRVYAGLLRFGFRLLYYEMAWTYDLVASVVSLGHWWEWQRQALPHLPASGRILEVGHGTGHLLETLHRRGQPALGFDLSPHMGRIARRRLARRGIELPLVRGRVQALPLAPAAVDGIVATFPTDYIVDPATVREFWRVLAPGGVVTVVPAATLRGQNLLVRFIRWLFFITGQSERPENALPDESPLMAAARAVYEQAGFTLSVETIDLAHSRVVVVIAQRPAGQP